MRDGRSNRKSNVVQFLSALAKNCQVNLDSLISTARQLELDGFDKIDWMDPCWHVTGGRLLKITGKNASSATFNFHYAPKLGGEVIESPWSDLIKALFILRFHRKHQSTSNQRNFIAAVGYVVHEAQKTKSSIFQIVPEHLDNACRLIANHYAEGTAYNMHKHVAEFAAHCDANKLCKVHFDYKYSKMRRPDTTGVLSHKRLDDPTVLETKEDRLVAPELYRLIGELYQRVPKDHKYRFYILVLTILACTGRRFSEITLLPFQVVQRDNENRSYLEYFPRKSSQGDTFTPKRRLYLPSQTLDIVEPVITELNEMCSTARLTAAEMQKTNGPDLTFLENITDEQRLYKNDLEGLGISGGVLYGEGWIRKNGYAKPDNEKLNAQGRRPRNPTYYTTKKAIIEYCRRDYAERYIAPIHIDQTGNKYYLQDMLLVRHMGLSSGAYCKWIATQCTHSMMTTFLRYLPDLASEYAIANIKIDFSSHNFRHTLNTLLDEGGLSDLLQTEWFGRSHPRDTKAYQHTSREKRALMLREDLKHGKAGGQIAEQLKRIPIEIQDAYLAARVNAVHDVGAGICVHNFAQTPCERHLQCSADCKDYVWAKEDKGRIEDLKRQYALTVVARETADTKAHQPKARKSIDWVIHNDKKLNTLGKQLADHGIARFDVHQYLEEANVQKV